MDITGAGGPALCRRRGALGVGCRDRRIPRGPQRAHRPPVDHCDQQHHRHQGRANINPFNLKPSLTNSKLFARDRNVCAYCGDRFHEEDLTREHIIPFGQNGIDTWMNVVTACRACNHRKSSRTPEQANMPLLYAPYVPSLWEDFILRNRRILADQMEFMMAHVTRSSRLVKLGVH